MAEVTVEAAMLAGTSRGMRAVVFVTNNIGYVFGINGDNDLDYMKTTNGGLTLSAATDVFTGTVEAFDVWYDQWTPGDTGRIIHIWYIQGGTGDDLLYTQLNTNGDVQTDRTVVSLTSTAASRTQFISGTKARGGNLYCAYNIDNITESGMYRSVDNGANWSVMTSPMEGDDGDQCKLFPANVADPQDIWLLYQDDSANELTLKEYDNSGNSFTESAALTMAEETTDATGQYGFDGSIRHSDGHLIAAYFDAYDALGASDFKVYDINGTGSLTALTDIATNVQDMYYPSVFLNQDQPDWIYVAYLGVSAGTSTLGSSVPVVYALSKNRGLTWTKYIAYSTSTTDYRQCWAPNNGERFLVVWMDISSRALLTNNDNSEEFGFTPLNNFQFASAKGQNNTGIISVTERIR